MTTPRRWVVNEDAPGCFHLISRCVRRAFLCGDRAAHRQEWLRRLVRDCSASFAVEVYSYAFMQNHFHLAVRTDPGRTLLWSADEVARRWCLAHPKTGRDGQPTAWPEADIQRFAKDNDLIEKWRKRLKSISWFMKAIKETVARRANKEDKCTGHFWEARFRSVPLLDEAALVACMAYIDLNPIRADIAQTPEESDYTSVQDRITSRQSYRKAEAALESLSLTKDEKTQATARVAQGPQANLWLAKLERGDVFPLELDTYLELVDATGRIVRGDKKGAIPANLLPILKRLELDVNAWISLMSSGGQMRDSLMGLSRGQGIGSLASRAKEAAERGRKWIVNTCKGLFDCTGKAESPPPKTPPKTPPEPAAA